MNELYKAASEQAAKYNDNPYVMDTCDNAIYAYSKGKIDFDTAMDIIKSANDWD